MPHRQDVPTRSWRTPREALEIVLDGRLLRRTFLTALIVGTILSLINQAHVIGSGRASIGTWVRIGANYLVPFLVSNVGALLGTRHTRS